MYILSFIHFETYNYIGQSNKVTLISPTDCIQIVARILFLKSFIFFYRRACGCTAWNSRGRSNGCHELPRARHLIYISSFYLRLPLSLEIGIVPTPNRLYLWGNRLRCWATKHRPNLYVWVRAQANLKLVLQNITEQLLTIFVILISTCPWEDTLPCLHNIITYIHLRCRPYDPTASSYLLGPHLEACMPVQCYILTLTLPQDDVFPLPSATCHTLMKQAFQIMG